MEKFVYAYSTQNLFIMFKLLNIFYWNTFTLFSFTNTHFFLLTNLPVLLIYLYITNSLYKTQPSTANHFFISENNLMKDEEAEGVSR